MRSIRLNSRLGGNFPSRLGGQSLFWYPLLGLLVNRAASINLSCPAVEESRQETPVGAAEVMSVVSTPSLGT